MDIIEFYSTKTSGHGTNPSILSSGNQTLWFEPQIKVLSYLGDIVNETSTQLEKLREIIQASQNSQIIEVLDLNSNRYTLTQPIQAVINFEGGKYYAELLEFDVYGEGEDIKSALEDLKLSFIQFVENLKKYRNLSKRLQVKKKILKKILRYEAK